MLPDNKSQRRKIIKGEDVRQYEYSQRHKYDMDKRLDTLGYRTDKEYKDSVSYLAW